MTAVETPARPPRPEPGPTRPYHFPRFERFTLDNGLRVVFAPVTKLPLVTLSLLADAGAVTDPDGAEGTALLTARLLLEGTHRRDGAALAEAFESIGASVEAHADWDASIVTATVLTGHLEEALDLVGEVVRQPAFREREVDRLKAERLSELLQVGADPRALADESFAAALYRDGSRYARPDGGDAQAVRGIAADAIRAFHAARYTPPTCTLVVVGDTSRDHLERAATRVFGEWSGESVPAERADDTARSTEMRIVVVPKEDAPQTELRIGHVGLPRQHPDYFDVVVMNAILGGLFNSRINLNLREAHGYTYGAFSGWDWRRGAGPFVASAAVRSDATDASVREVLAEIDRMRTSPVSDDELSLAISYLDGVFPIRYETTAAIAAALSSLVVHGLPEDYFDCYRERIRAVTAEGVLAAARAHLHPEQLLVLAVGDPAIIEGPLAALGFGTVSVEPERITAGAE